MTDTAASYIHVEPDYGMFDRSYSSAMSLEEYAQEEDHELSIAIQNSISDVYNSERSFQEDLHLALALSIHNEVHRVPTPEHPHSPAVMLPEPPFEKEPLNHEIPVCSQCFNSLRLSSWHTCTSNTSLTSHLHLTCISCNTLKCRGCLASLPSCSRTCAQSPVPCNILSHCNQVRLIALYEVLQAFDHHYLRGLGDGCDRQDYLHAILSPLADPGRDLELRLLNIMESLQTVFLALQNAPLQPRETETLNRSVAEGLIQHSFVLELFRHLLTYPHQAQIWIQHHNLFSLSLELMSFLSLLGMSGLITQAQPRTSSWVEPLRSRLEVEEEFACDEPALSSRGNQLLKAEKDLKDLRKRMQQGRTRDKIGNLLKRIKTFKDSVPDGIHI